MTTIAEVTGCPRRSVERHWPLILRELEKVQQSAPASLAGALGTIAIETASTFEPVTEAFWLSAEWRHRNLRYAPYWGRGFIQLTWDYNYAAYGPWVGEDLLRHPDRALDPEVAAKVFAAYWSVRDIQEPAVRGDWREVRRRVLGGYDGVERLERITTELLSR